MYQIAIDGPAGTGKSTIAKLLANRLNITYIDSGAFYRTFTLYCLNSKIDITKPINDEVFKDFDIVFENSKVYLNGNNVSSEIRTSYVSENVCNIAGRQNVRDEITRLIQKIASQKSVIMDGRDVADNILPNAKYKFFIDASLEERTKRRLKDLIKAGESISYDELYNNIKQREFTEYNRNVGKLKMHKDAIYIDNSNMEIEEVLDKIISYIC